MKLLENSSAAFCSALFALTFLSFALPSKAVAADPVQEPKGGWRVDKVEDTPEMKRRRSQINRILTARVFADASEEKVFEDYYRLYALSRWTLPENRALVASSFRTELITNLKNGRSGPPYEKLSQIALELLTKYSAVPAEGEQPYHPACRVNAMLMLGELNAREVVKPSDLPVPLPAALSVMLAAVEDPKQLDSVKVAALVGITRHAKLGGIKSPTAAAKVGEAMLKLASEKAAPGVSSDGHAWMRSMACEVLGLLGSAGDDNSIANLMAGIAADSEKPFFLRTQAAAALGKMKLVAGENLDANKLALAMGKLADDAADAELAGDRFHSQRLKTRLVAASSGLDAVTEAAAGASTAKKIAAAIDALLEPYGDRRATDEEVKSGTESALPKLKESLK